jgi:CRISPR-associated protein Cas2
MRRHYLVTYDISDDRRRNRVFRTLHGYGNHVQYSVFLCELDEQDLVRMRGQVGREIHHREDQVLVLDLGRSVHPLDSIVDAIGRALEVKSRALVL